MAAALSYPVVKLFNRVLADYPAAREQLARHAGKVIAASVGPLDGLARITAEGLTEMAGEEGGPPPDVAFQISPALLPRLARREEAAFREVAFRGDSELAALLSDLARAVEWDVEEDLSRWVGDIAAHRLVDSVRRTREWRKEAMQRLAENVAEYLTEERCAFITGVDLESLTRANEVLRDDVARLEARLAVLATSAHPACRAAYPDAV